MPHPVLAMPMLEGAGDRVIDYSGHGNHGDINSADWVAGGLDFVVANNDYVTVDSIDLNANTIDYTLSILFSRDTTSVYEYLFDQRDSNDDGFNIRFVNNVVWAQLDTIDVKSASTITDTDIHHVICSMDRDGYGQIYIDGKADGSPVALNSETMAVVANLLICGSSSSGQFEGRVFKAEIYKNALSAAQAKFLYDNPYFMYEIPKELYGYVAGAPPSGNPFWYYDMLKKRNR